MHSEIFKRLFRNKAYLRGCGKNAKFASKIILLKNWTFSVWKLLNFEIIKAFYRVPWRKKKSLERQSIWGLGVGFSTKTSVDLLIIAHLEQISNVNEYRTNRDRQFCIVYSKCIHLALKIRRMRSQHFREQHNIDLIHGTIFIQRASKLLKI